MSDVEDTAVGSIVAATRDALDVYGQTIRDESAATLAQSQADLAAADQANATLQTQVDQDATAIAADRETIAGLQAQHAADQATIGQQAARITQLEAELQPGMVVGARLRDVPFAAANAAVGPIGGTRKFYDVNDALPATFTPDPDWPAGALWVVSYKLEDQPNLASFAQSLQAQGGLLGWHHEPEADFASGQEFLDAWHAQQALVKAAAPGLPFGMIAGAYQYRTAGTGYDGSYIPSDADWYGIDTYLVGAASGVNKLQPLETEPRFQRWLSLVPADAVKLATEYARGLTDTTQWDAQRAQLIPQDQAYLDSLGFAAWFYWYTNGGTGKNWRFTDSGSQAAWRAAAGG